ncbi:hypothetical protein B0T16DRAFT_329534 [Cercophora newfieldiana]|uniref:Uncharacterized protein n=1 Tax=Cercophora newfieldiana TaxID=92897 RepID=A0AA39Y777_9PEZI|nr:hypothetical protein B0T16DRAFT_329534 [Cercophora newfieldiana]
MSSHSHLHYPPPADLSEVDDAPEDVPVAHHERERPTTRGRGRGRGRVYRGKGKIAKPAPTKPTGTGRGRRHKVYESARAQAAHERIQELKSAFATVAKVVKPAAQEIADRSVNELLQDPDLMKRVPEFDHIQNFLRTRLADTKKTLNFQLKAGKDMAKHVYEGEKQNVGQAYTRCLTELCDERYDQLMTELDILEYLHDNNLPVDLPAVTEEGEYLFKEISQKQYDEQSGPYVEFRDGVEVPFHGKMVGELMTKEYQLPEIESPKRKADGQPDGQPSTKMAATTENGEGVPSLPRHVSGLLSAVEALEERASTPAESSSNAPTPAPEPADAPSPGNADHAPSSGGDQALLDGLEIPLPRYMTAPDEYGVRIITRKATRLDIPNNRIAVPNIFEWDELDIGFRDSANCVQKGATKAKRGKYLGKPGSNFMFIDRRVGTWDSTQSAGEFDEALLKKHALHPTLGIVLPTSLNEEEPPRPFVSGWKSTVLVSPRGEIVHASRTIPLAKRDERARNLYTKLQMKELMRDFCEKEGIAGDNVDPTDAEREAHRRSVLIARGMDPDAVRPPLPSPVLESPPLVDTKAFSNFVEEAISAASILDAEEDAARSSSTQPKRPTTSSRPYDAIRDVFTESASATESAPAHQASSNTTPAVDTQNLSILANIAEADRKHEPVYAQQPPVYEQQPGYTQPQPQPREFYNPPGGASQLAYPPHMEQPGHDSARSNDFLRTALNPPPTEYHPPSDYPAGPLGQPPIQGQGPRTPFSSTGAAKALPALRPVRGLSSDGSPLPEPHGSPAPQNLGMVVSNSGTFYPPAPSRPFHNGYVLQEPGAMHGLQQPPMQPQPLSIPMGPLQPPPLAPPPPEGMSPYAVSPPPFHGGMPLAPAPMMQQPGTPSQMSPIAPPQQAAPSAPSPRSRPGSSSAASSGGPASGPAAATGSSKYRKLEPAPTPPHRLGYAGNGQELRTVQFDYREAIKDYTPVEAPPRHGPTHIRGWTHNNLKKTSVSAGAGSNGNRKTEEDGN